MMSAVIRPRRERTKHELRCFCRGNPMLAMYGVDENLQLYIHVKIYKSGRVYGEVYYTGGVVKIRCRNCLRWNRVNFISSSPEPSANLVETDAPMVATENPPGQ